ncbi:hypothetical protein [Tabrizicola sp.]|uniref:hypothetical protein n=1 Tax=Tabrizicola sp. TaxID=2005166 RepID=UPI003F339EDD
MKVYVEEFGSRGQFNALSHSGWVIIAAFLGVLACGSCLGAIAAGRDSWLLAVDGTAIDAVVLDKHVAESDPERHRPASYYLQLAYAPPGTDRVEVEDGVSPSRYDAVDPGDHMTIRYVPSNPDVFEIEPGGQTGSERFGWWLGIGSVIGALGAAVGAWLRWRNTVPETVA